MDGQAARRQLAGLTTLGPLLFFVAVIAGCRSDRTGEPCHEDSECGFGYDCYRNVCHRVCSKDDECRGDQTCHRYRCLDPEGTIPGGPALPVSTGRDTPPPPDPTVAELRAIRRELELLRQEVARLASQPQANPGSCPKTTPPRSPLTGRKPTDIELPPSSTTPAGK